MTTIAPCPFCGCELEKSESISNRLTSYFAHPAANDEDGCIAGSIRVPISNREDDKRRLALWNRRTPSPQPNVAPDEDAVETVARRIYEDAHKGMSNIWSWNDRGLDDEHPGTRERYLGYARSAIAATPPPVQHVVGITFPLPSHQEQAAFEEWATESRYEMHQHPLHYLFVDKQTNAARQGWKAALAFVRKLSEGKEG